ncbi:MAG: diaminopimelate epimerase [Clostridiales bacterium]|jgi:diaminopimelate epimerase|nr:diaminopimelate epimerase [Clostridiales bacterium]
MKFTKMHGIGNDYIYINCFEEELGDIPSLAVEMSDRHFGVGSDGLVLISRSDRADFRMRMFNADGTEAEMCGNASRCVGKYVYDRGMTDKTSLSLETLAGIKRLDLHVENGAAQAVTVDMGEPVLTPQLIPVDYTGEEFINKIITADNREYAITCVSMGNPHAVTYVTDVGGLDLCALGPKFENHSIFPNRVNTEFVEVMDSKTIRMRVWERGAGETLACGTGACAAVVASALNGLTGRKVTVRLLGGNLEIDWNADDNRVYMTGAAVTVFDGVWER